MAPPVPQPVISSLSPTSGPVGSNVQINGTNFDRGTFFNVYFNGIQATQLFTYTNTTIVARVPVGATTGNVQLRNDSAEIASNVKPFTVTGSAAPVLVSLTPNNGGIGRSVVIAGANFGATQGTSTVTFNGIAAMVTSWAAGSITAVVPVGATTGNVIVTVAGVASNTLVFTVTTPSNGGTSAPIGMLLIPVTQFNTPVVLTFDTTNYDDPSNGSFYSYKVEEVAAGRTPTCNRQMIIYRNLGPATLRAILSGFNQNTGAVETKEDIFQIGFAPANNVICAIVRGLTLSSENLQYTLLRFAGEGPMSIIKVRLEGRVELTSYA